MTAPGWDVPREDGEKLIDAAEANSGDGLEIKLGGDPIYAAQEASSPEGIGFLGAAIVLLIAFGSVVAAGLPLIDRARRARHHLGRPDRPARQLRRRPRLDHGGVGADRYRGRDRLLAARPDAVPHGAERGQGPPRRRRRGRHHRGAQRDHRRLHRRDRRPRSLPDRSSVHVRGRALGLLRRPGRDARRRHPAARDPLLPRAEGRSPPDPLPRPDAEDRGRRRVARGTLEPRRPAPSLDRRDRRDGGAARARRARARHAPRIPRRRERPARHDDPPGVRPEHGGIRARHERAARDRRRPTRSVGRGGDRRVRRDASRRGRRRLRASLRRSTRRATRRS